MAKITDRCTDGFGDRFRAARKALGLTQQEVADRLGVLNTAVSKWELGKAQIDGCTRLALEYTCGIAREYLRSGTGPMLVAQGNARPRLMALEAELGGSVDRWIDVVPELGMSPRLQDKSRLGLSRVRLPEEGVIYAMSTVHGHDDHFVVGVARVAEDGHTWWLYRDGDQKAPGKFPAVEVVRGRSLWRAVVVTQRVLPASA